MSDPNSKLWDQVHDANDTMHGDGTSDADAVERLAELLAQATATDYSSTGEITEYDGSVTLSTLSRSDTTVVMAASFAPGGQIHPHDHEGFVGAMRVLSGSFEFNTFEIVDGLRRPDHDPVQLRPTGSTTLTAGDISTITADAGHVHTVVAGPDGGSFVDAYLMRTNPGSCRFFQPTGEPDADGVINVEGVLDAPIH